MDFYALFIALVCICMVFHTSSDKINGKEGAFYYPVTFAAFGCGFAFISCLLMIMGKDTTEGHTEDHYFVENQSRVPLLMTFGMLMLWVWMWTYFCLPEVVFEAGAEQMAFTPVTDAVEWQQLAFCNSLGLSAGLVVCLLAEYFTA
jgi:hypothetical protein